MEKKTINDFGLTLGDTIDMNYGERQITGIILGSLVTVISIRTRTRRAIAINLISEHTIHTTRTVLIEKRYLKPIIKYDKSTGKKGLFYAR